VRSVAEFFDRYPHPRGGVRGSGFITIKVSPSLRERAFLLADAILTSLLDRGHEVVASQTGVDVLVSGAAFELLVKDLLPKVRTSPPTWDLAFTFRFERRNVGTWRDTDLTPATGFIPEAIATIEALAPTARPIQEERIRVAAAARLAKEEEKRARQRLRQRLANRPKYIMWLVLQLNDARMLQALAEYLDDGGAHPRIRQLREDICTLAGRLMASLALDEVEAELKVFDLYDEARGDETMPAP
jgi:hypothetical protein